MANILVVDDEPTINGLISLVLQLEGHSVRQAYKGEVAIQMAHENVHDLILLDVMMPGMSGYQVACTLCESTATKHIPIIFVSASAKPDNLEKESSMSPILDYVRKPFEIRYLIERVNRALRAHDAGTSGTVNTS
jgi:DNA-binding response OmpR family regulator